MTTRPSKRTKTTTSPTAGMPPEIAQTLQQRGALAPAAGDAIPTATTPDEAMAKLEAMTAELAEQAGTALTKPAVQAAAVQDLTATPAPTAKPLSQSKKAAPVIRVGRALDTSNPNYRYTELPPAVEKFVQSALHAPALPSTSFKNAAEYYAAYRALCNAVQTLPATVPAPFGWEMSSDGTVDVTDILQAHGAGRQAEMLHDLIRWAVTVPLAQQAADANTTLRNLQQRGEAADARLKDGPGAALLHRFRALCSLLQTAAFSGKPGLLIDMLKDDWKYMQQGVQYRTPLAELTGSALTDANITPAVFTSGSVQEFTAQLHGSLIQGFSVAAPFLTTESNSIAVDRAQVTAWLRCSRPLADADAPVLVTLGYQELLGASEINYNGLSNGWRDVTVLTLEHGPDGLTVKPGSNPGSALFDVAAAAADVLLKL